VTVADVIALRRALEVDLVSFYEVWTTRTT
jgi:hypothetical protein